MVPDRRMSSDVTQVQPPPRRPNPLVQAIEALGQTLTKTVEDIGGLASLLADVIRWAARPPYRVVNLMAQLDFVGVGSVLIVALTGVFSGMVFAHQSARAFEMFNAKIGRASCRERVS
jgi:phospholipid/cholesterol/gamma-HCH transport system permease protein